MLITLPLLVQVAPALTILQHEFLPPLPLSVFPQLIAYHLLTTGLSNIIWVPLSNTFGRRAILILSMLLAMLTTVWCGLATSFTSLLAARAIQGVGLGPADSIAPEVVGEVFFVHERGRAMVCLPV